MIRRNDSQAESEFIGKAKAIGRFLLDELYHDDLGPLWQTCGYDEASRTYFPTLDLSILNGCSGIILYFLDLYVVTRDPHYLEVAKKVAQRVSKDQIVSDPPYVTFYTGALGFVYACLRIYELTNEYSFLAIALDRAKGYSARISSDKLSSDILSGDAGALYVLTYLYHFSADENILERIEFLLTRLIERARPAEKGIKWGHAERSFDAYTGFSHGASGIAHILVQLGHYFKREDLFWAAEQAMAYEDQYFDHSIKNWFDLRLIPDQWCPKEVFPWTLDKFKAGLYDINAWAHGAAGIATARIYAAAYLDPERYPDMLNKAIERCVKDVEDQRWVHYAPLNGYGGIANTLLCYSQFTGETKFGQIAADIALAAAKAFDDRHSTIFIGPYVDMGYMSGIAGIGHLLLRVEHASTLPSVLQPTLPDVVQACSVARPLNVPHFRKEFFKRYFIKTIAQIDPIVSASLLEAKHLSDFANGLKSQFINIPSITLRSAAEKTFIREHSIVKVLERHKGQFAFSKQMLYMKAKSEELLNMSDKILLSCKLMVNPLISLTDSLVDFINEDSNTDSCLYQTALLVTDMDVRQIELDKNVLLALHLAESKPTVRQLIKGLSSALNLGKTIDADIYQQMLNYIRQLIGEYYLTAPSLKN